MGATAGLLLAAGMSRPARAADPPEAGLGLEAGRVALTPAQVDAAAARRLSRVKACYKTALDTSPQLFGVLAIGFRVDPAGKVTDRWIAMSTLGNPTLEGCALKAFDGLVFPAPGGYGAEARFGMLLSVDPAKKPKTDKFTALPDRAAVQEAAWKAAIAGKPAPTPTPGAASSRPPF